MRKARSTMDRIGMELLSTRKATALGKASPVKSSLGELSLEGHDLLTALVRANMDTDLPESQRMSDEDVLSRESSSTLHTPYKTETNKKSKRFRRSLSQGMRRRRKSQILPM